MSTIDIVVRVSERLGMPLVSLLLRPGSMFSLLSLASALALAVGVLAQRRRARGRAVRVRVLMRALLPRRLLRGASMRADLGFFLLNTLITGTLIGWAVTSSTTVGRLTREILAATVGPVAPMAPGPWAAGAIRTPLIFLAFEFGYWLDHYLKHRVPALWAFHRVHHAAETLSPLTVFRVHPVDSVIFVNIVALCSGIAAGTADALTGIRGGEFTLWGTNVVLLGFTLTVQHLQHSHLWIAFTGIWGRLLASPAHHQLHHSSDPAHYGKNLGSFLSLWDWLFGTLLIPERGRGKLTFGGEAAADWPHSVTGGLVTPFARGLASLVAIARPRTRG